MTELTDDHDRRGNGISDTLSIQREARLRRSEELFRGSVHYNPAMSESWANLAYIAFIDGDCDAAAEFGSKAVETNRSDEQREGFARFLEGMAGDVAERGCAEVSAEFGRSFFER